MNKLKNFLNELKNDYEGIYEYTLFDDIKNEINNIHKKINCNSIILDEYYNKILSLIKSINEHKGKKSLRDFYTLEIELEKYIKEVEKLENTCEQYPNILLICCMDFRFFNHIIDRMNKLGNFKNFNMICFAGASLSYTQKKYKNWKQSILDHIDLSIKLHDIKEIYIVDHLSCSFYKSYLEIEEDTINLHEKYQKIMKNDLEEKYKNLKITTKIINIEGYFV